MNNPDVLVAIVNNLADFAIVREQQWYRIPVSSVSKWLRNRWPPEWLAFYHTKIFGDLAYAVHYYAPIISISEKARRELLPDQPNDYRSMRRYYQLHLGPLQRLPNPIFSRRFRRIVFISTTWAKFMQAVEINDLYDESPLEDRLWAALRRLEIQAERQEFVRVNKQNFALDFAIYCRDGKIDIETDGDFWHANPEKATEDNYRDNALKTSGWKVLRFNTPQIREELTEYCVPTIVENVNNLAGIADGRLVPRKFDPKNPDGSQQMGLFDD
jgi:very-short-patch-repair endonuclease